MAGEDWSGTAREEWTIPGVYFDAAGWRLSESTPTRMVWHGAFGGTMTLTCEATPEWTAANLDLDSVRAEHRASASARGGGLVSAEFVEMADGALALEVVTKDRAGAGFGYGFEGRLLIDESPLAFSVVVRIDEVRSGVRESIVNGLRLQRGDLTLAALMSGPFNSATGGRTIPGMKLDPYDPAFDEDAIYSASDDPRLDELLQTHPLAVTRSSLRRARATWQCDSRADGREAGGAAARPPLPRSTGPRVVLSDDFFAQLSDMVKDRSRTH
jgi:hypothetical protein